MYDDIRTLTHSIAIMLSYNIIMYIIDNSYIMYITRCGNDALI